MKPSPALWKKILPLGAVAAVSATAAVSGVAWYLKAHDPAASTLARIEAANSEVQKREEAVQTTLAAVSNERQKAEEAYQRLKEEESQKEKAENRRREAAEAKQRAEAEAARLAKFEREEAEKKRQEEAARLAKARDKAAFEQILKALAEPVGVMPATPDLTSEGSRITRILAALNVQAENAELKSYIQKANPIAVQCGQILNEIAVLENKKPDDWEVIWNLGKGAVNQLEALDDENKLGDRIGAQKEAVDSGKVVKSRMDIDSQLQRLHRNYRGALVNLRRQHENLIALTSKCLGEKKSFGFMGLQYEADGSDGIVSSVNEGMPADRAGIKQGEIIKSINGKKVAINNTLVPCSAFGYFDGETAQVEVKSIRGDTRMLSIARVSDFPTNRIINNYVPSWNGTYKSNLIKLVNPLDIVLHNCFIYLIIGDSKSSTTHIHWVKELSVGVPLTIQHPIQQGDFGISQCSDSATEIKVVLFADEGCIVNSYAYTQEARKDQLLSLFSTLKFRCKDLPYARGFFSPDDHGVSFQMSGNTSICPEKVNISMGSSSDYTRQQESIWLGHEWKVGAWNDFRHPKYNGYSSSNVTLEFIFPYTDYKYRISFPGSP